MESYAGFTSIQMAKLAGILRRLADRTYDFSKSPLNFELTYFSKPQAAWERNQQRFVSKYYDRAVHVVGPKSLNEDPRYN